MCAVESCLGDACCAVEGATVVEATAGAGGGGGSANVSLELRV